MLSSEYEDSENKQSLREQRELIESLAAFATARGGTVHVGITPNGERAGVRLGHNTLEHLANEIKRHTQPPLYPSVSVEGPEDRAVITVSIEESPIKPVMAFGRPLKRVGRTNQCLSRDETERLMNQTRGRTWDAMPCFGFELQKVDRKLLDAFLRRAGQDTGAAAEDVLENLGLLLEGQALSNAAALLFARQPQIYFPEAQVKCGRFIGKDSTRFLDQQTLDGDVFGQLEGALAFVKRNTRQAIHISGRAEREDIPEYPVEAIREAIANAICHRDYSLSGTVQVRIYDDRLEVWNPGNLPFGLTIEDLYREHSSRPHNPMLASALYRARIIEHWGTGTLRIVRACEAQGMPRPEFIAEAGTFKVRFPGIAQRLFRDIVGLPEHQRRAIAYIQEHGQITTGEYVHLARIGERAARKNLVAMVDANILLRQGSGPQTHYILVPTSNVQ